MSKAIEWGIALGLLVAMVIMVLPTGRDDFSVHLWPAGRTLQPYSVTRYWYPVPCTWVLRLLGLLPREVALIVVWLIDILVCLWACKVWRTPAWVVLLSPVFLPALVYGHLFDAVFLAGLTLALLGWEYVPSRWDWVGSGMALMLFKPQLAWVPCLMFFLMVAFWPGMRRALLVPFMMGVVTTLADYLLTGQWWIVPFVQGLQVAGSMNMGWNDSLWRLLGPFSLLWLVPVLWLASKVQCFRREVWLCLLLGLLISPYFGIFSLWPVLATAGCLVGEKT